MATIRKSSNLSIKNISTHTKDNQALIKYVCTDCKYKWSSDWTSKCPKCGSRLIKHLPVVV